MGCRFRPDRRRSNRAPTNAQSRRVAGARPAAACLDRDFRVEHGRDARDVGGLRRHFDTAGLSSLLRVIHGRISGRIGSDARRRKSNRGFERTGFRREPRDDQILPRGADVSADARGDSRPGNDVSPRASPRRPRELHSSRSADRNCGRLELRRRADTSDRRLVAAVCARACRIASRQCDRATRMGYLRSCSDWVD